MFRICQGIDVSPAIFFIIRHLTRLIRTGVSDFLPRKRAFDDKRVLPVWKEKAHTKK
jgi:hypothetical protein